MPSINLTSDELNKLGQRLGVLIHAGIEAREGLIQRWRKIEESYDDAPPGSEDASKMVPVHVNLLSTRMDALTSLVCGVVGKQDPYMTAEDYTTAARADRLEKTNKFFWKRAKFEENLREASTHAGLTNKAIWKLSYRGYAEGENKKVALSQLGIVMEVIPPTNWVCVPAIDLDLREAKLCGNRFQRRRRWIEDRIASGEYIDAKKLADEELVAGRIEDLTGGTLASVADPNVTGQEREDDLIEVWDVVVRLDPSDYTGQNPTREDRKPETLHRVLVAMDTNRVLLIEEYAYSRPMYFESCYIVDKKHYWSHRSVGYRLQVLQAIYDVFWTGMYNGSMTEAIPLIIGEGLPEKFTQYAFGDVIPNAENMNNPPWSPQSRFSAAQAFIWALTALERIADQSARISQNTMGSVTSKAGVTLGEQQIVASGVAAGQEEYIANFTSQFAAMAEGTSEILEHNYNDWAPWLAVRPITAPDASGMDAPVVDPSTGEQMTQGMLDVSLDDFRAPVMWEVMGKTPGHTPQAKAQAVGTLFEMAADPSSGLDKYKLTSVAVNSLGLNAENVQTPEDQMPEQQLLMMLRQMGIQPDMAMQLLQGAIAEINGGTDATGKGGGQKPAEGVAGVGGGQGLPGMAVAAA